MTPPAVTVAAPSVTVSAPVVVEEPAVGVAVGGAAFVPVAAPEEYILIGGRYAYWHPGMGRWFYRPAGWRPLARYHVRQMHTFAELGGIHQVTVGAPAVVVAPPAVTVAAPAITIAAPSVTVSAPVVVEEPAVGVAVGGAAFVALAAPEEYILIGGRYAYWHPGMGRWFYRPAAWRPSAGYHVREMHNFAELGRVHQEIRRDARARQAELRKDEKQQQRKEDKKGR
ncbi:MAG: hypothetical protein ACLQVX_02910 [Limisphaerales bacterium]